MENASSQRQDAVPTDIGTSIIEILGVMDQLRDDMRSLQEENSRLRANLEEQKESYDDLKSKLDELKEDNSRAHSYFDKSIINLQPEQSELWEDRYEVLVSLLERNKGMMKKSRAQELMGLSRYQMRCLLNFAAHRISTSKDPNNGNERLLILRKRSVS